MGIPGLSKWISSNFPQVFTNSSKKITNSIPDHLYIDLNYILHLKSKRFNNNNSSRFIQKIINHLTNYRVNQRMFIAMDGMAPLAKIQEQMSRRQRRPLKSGFIDPNNFTPGLPFMAKLERIMVSHLISPKNDRININTTNNANRIAISGASIIEEGEVKILRDIYQQSEPINASIISGDSDFFIQSLKITKSNLTIIDDQNNSFGHFNNISMIEILKESRMDFILFGLMMGTDVIQPLKFAPGLNFLWDSFLQFKHLICQEQKQEEGQEGQQQEKVEKAEKQGIINLNALKEFSSFYLKRKGITSPPLAGYNFSSPQMIASYIQSLEWNMNQLEMDPIQCFQTQVMKCHPISIFDLDQMNVSQVQNEMNNLKLKEEIVITDEFKYFPAAISIILLNGESKNNSDNLNLLSRPLRELAIHYRGLTFANNLESLLWLCRQIKQINPNEFTTDEWNASIYNRLPTSNDKITNKLTLSVKAEKEKEKEKAPLSFNSQGSQFKPIVSNLIGSFKL